jgi:hypothetical protein
VGITCFPAVSALISRDENARLRVEKTAHGEILFVHLLLLLHVTFSPCHQSIPNVALFQPSSTAQDPGPDTWLYLTHQQSLNPGCPDRERIEIGASVDFPVGDIPLIGSSLASLG